MSDFVAVADADSVREGESLVVQVGREEVALFRVNGEVIALRNFCPHRGGPIGEGLIEGDTVTCPWHDWPFEISTGVCRINPGARIQKYPVRINGDKVEVAV